MGTVSLSVPQAWAARLPVTETERQVWSPAADRNPGKETLAVRIAPRRPQMSDDDILTAASTAQGLLPGVELLGSRAVTTQRGLKALWIETSFKPPGSTVAYRRAHVTAIGKKHVVHVFYTATTPQPNAQVLRDAIDSLQEEG